MRVQIPLMAATKNLLPCPDQPQHHPCRSRIQFPLMVSCFLLTLALLGFFFFFHTYSPIAMAPNQVQNDAVSTPGLRSCDLFNGSWVLDESGPLYPPGSCPHVNDAFNCFSNGRPDHDYLRYRWKPHGCDIPRFDGRGMMSMLRNKRVVFVGDSLNRNMWQSLICALRHALPKGTSIQEVSNPKQSKIFGSFVFEDYNSTIEYVSAPFLVQRWRVKGKRMETLKLDTIKDTAHYRSADIIVFNTGHWWTFDKARNGIDFFQEGDHVYSKLAVDEAFKRALRTWARWVDTFVDSSRSTVFFSGYSASHFRGGQWNSGGVCDGEKKPTTKEKELSPYPWTMREVESVISEMKTPVTYLNITRMTDYRKDGHPSIYRLPSSGSSAPRASGGAAVVQDCIHWCLPGIPDTWNQLFYAHLLMMLPQT